MITVREYIKAKLDFFGINASDEIIAITLAEYDLTGDELLSDLDKCKYKVPLADLLNESILAISPNTTKTRRMGNFSTTETSSISTAETIKNITAYVNKIYAECGVDLIGNDGIYDATPLWKKGRSCCGCW